MQHIVKAWTLQNNLLEFYRYAPGPADSLPKHLHDEYQFCLSLDFPGEYYYRGTHYSVPVGSLSVIHPGEIHLARDVEERQTVATFRMIYVHSELLQAVATEIGGRAASLPFFATAIVLDSDLARRFLELHLAVETTAPKLEQDERLLSVLEQFILRYADSHPSPRVIGQERRWVQQVREYLAEHLTDNVSLARLAEMVNLSPYHLSRVFRQEVGLPPHRYQIQLRIERAKQLLCQGLSLTEVASQTGFADQNHLARHFKRLVQVTPGRYLIQNSKNVRDAEDSLM